MTGRIPRHEMLVRIAEVVAERSSCSRGSVGCLIVRDGRIIATGYNGAPTGMKHCEHDCWCSGGVNDEGEFKYGPLHPGCPRHDPNIHCTIALHAEANALVFAARHGLSTDGAELYTTASPCLNCAGLIVNAGITQVWCGAPHTYGHEGINLLVLRNIAVASAREL